jgi:hypothetical protein
LFDNIAELNLEENLDEYYEHPYQKTVEKLKEMQWIQSPTSKLDHIYHCLKFKLADEIDEFYSYCGNKIEDHITMIK